MFFSTYPYESNLNSGFNKEIKDFFKDGSDIYVIYPRTAINKIMEINGYEDSKT